VWLAMLIFCRRILVNKPQELKRNGPLLLACNHPNSFLDATILAELFKQDVYSLTRGDVFKKPVYRRILRSLKLLPVYRETEGVGNLGINYETFDECKNIFRKNGIVLIFSEARSLNEWHLRPLKKGTARLAFGSWDENIPVDVLPVGINYSSFRRFSKNVFIKFGDIMTIRDFDLNHGDGKRYQSFTNNLQEQLQELVFEIDKNDIQKQKTLLEQRPSVLTNIILFIPAVLGWLLHAPLYLPLKNLTHKKTFNNDHYDSVLVALLLFSYPFYVLLISIIALLVTGNFLALLLIIVLPFTAWAYAQLKPQLDKL